MDLSFDAQVMYFGSPVTLKSAKESPAGDIATVTFQDGHSGEVMVADLIEMNMPIAEDEYISGWLTRQSPLIRA